MLVGIGQNQNQVFLALGSNLGDKLSLLETALAEITQKIGEITLRSSIYSSPAFGFDSTNDFYNMVIRLESVLTAEEILAQITEIELLMGRTSKSIDKKYGDRLIDIDILYFNKKLITSQKLTVPHPEIPNRKFVLVPLAEISGDFSDPRTGKTVLEMLKNTADKSLIFNINSEKS